MVRKKRIRSGAKHVPKKVAEFRPLSIKVNLYRLVSDAVENGISLGWMHAHKHNDTPDEFAIEQAIHNDVMSAICELIDFEASE